MSRATDAPDRSPLVRTTVSDGSLAIAVVRAVAAVENREPQSLRPLGEVIDSEALETVVTSAGDPVRVAFDYVGYRVVIDGGAVELY